MLHYVYSSVIYNSQKLERTQMFFNRGMDTENVVQLHRFYVANTSSTWKSLSKLQVYLSATDAALGPVKHNTDLLTPRKYSSEDFTSRILLPCELQVIVQITYLDNIYCLKAKVSLPWILNPSISHKMAMVECSRYT